MNKFIAWLCCVLLSFCGASVGMAQEIAIQGKITDESNRPLEFATVALFFQGQSKGTSTDSRGNYKLSIRGVEQVVFRVSFTGYESIFDTLQLSGRKQLTINKKMKAASTNLPLTTIEGDRERKTSFTVVDPTLTQTVPSLAGGVEGLLKSLPGVNASSELTSQYSVRGGNFDENLIYVNDVEVFRPMLVRSGEQEGLSFVNPDLVSTLKFSAGGFDAKYGDKMSSVLDVQYKTPTHFGGSASIDMTGGSIHLEGVANKNKIKYLLGVRQKSNQYLLKSLGTEGEFKPSFTDVQALFTYDLTEKWQLSLLGNYARNVYSIVPEKKETIVGNYDTPKRFTIYYDGQELDKYNSLFGALSLTYAPNTTVRHKFTYSAYHSVEREAYDIAGAYWLREAYDETTDGETLGVGAYLDHARNYLDAIVMNAEYRGSFNKQKHFLSWGLKYEYRDIYDKLNEWRLVDSSGYTLPNYQSPLGSDNPTSYYPEVINRYVANNHLLANVVTAFVQDVMALDGVDKHWQLIAGTRFSYWDFNKEFFVSPRASLFYQPDLGRNNSFRFSTGCYNQTPFYRELRKVNGELNTNIKSQKSIHFVLANDYEFIMWNRPFKLTTELYYKHLYDLIPYEVDNVRIRYTGENLSKGYATGIDFRLNGEIVEGVDSWMSLSFMHSMENISYTDLEGQRQETGYIPLPTNQAMVFNLFFQDYLMNNKNVTINLNLVFGAGLPFGPSEALTDMSLFADRENYKLPAYRRVDIGFSFKLKDEKKGWKNDRCSFLKNIWLTAEIFNLFNTRNTVSYQWISDVYGQHHGIPNNLTPILLNAKLKLSF